MNKKNEGEPNKKKLESVFFGGNEKRLKQQFLPSFTFFCDVINVGDGNDNDASWRRDEAPKNGSTVDGRLLR